MTLNFLAARGTAALQSWNNSDKQAQVLLLKQVKQEVNTKLQLWYK